MSKTVAFIPLRGGSKSIPNKNINIIAGKPLIEWVTNAAEKCSLIDEIIVSTESNLIENIVKSINSNKISIINRSIESASDNAPTEIALLEYCKQSDAQDIILIQATSPLLTTEDLNKGISIYRQKEVDSVVSTTIQKRFLWKNNKPTNYNPLNRPRRQDFKGIEVENGAFYISSRKNILTDQCRLSGNIHTCLMPEETYFELDEPQDWNICEQLLKLKNPQWNKRNKNLDIKLYIIGLNGVLTDNIISFNENGQKLLNISKSDQIAIEELQKKGIKIILITESNTATEKKIIETAFNFDDSYFNISNKFDILQKIIQKYNLKLEQIAAIGDEIEDLELLKSVAMPICPNNTIGLVKEIPKIIKLSTIGGTGVIRASIKYLTGETFPSETSYIKNHLIFNKPWGTYETIVEDNGYKVKKIIVNPAGVLSLQMHYHRCEHWVVVSGVAKITVGEKVDYYKPKEHIYIPLGEKHRLENDTQLPIIIIEVQSGLCLEENDIIRFKDIYGRQ